MQTRDIRLIGLDLDCTTLNAKKEITPRVREAIAGAIRRGVTVLPATGRAKAGIPEAFLRIPGVRYALCANGAMVYDLAEDKVLLESPFDTKTALAVLDILQPLNVITAVFVGGEVYSVPYDYNKLTERYDENLIRYLQVSRNIVPDLRVFVEESPIPVEKFSLMFYRPKDRAKTMKALQEQAGCAITSSLEDNLEINAAGVNKGEGLLALGRHLGYTREQVMGVGDGVNDLEMLQTVGYGVAMANAVPEVLAVADWVTTSCEEDGVAVAIESVLPPVNNL